MRDRRGVERFTLALPVTVWDSSGKPIEGRVCDISASGVRFQADAPFREGSSIGLVFLLPPDLSGNVMSVWASGRVVRVDGESGGRVKGVCVTFVSVKYDVRQVPSAKDA